MGFVIGFDLGTFEAKGVLVDERGTVRASARRAYAPATPVPGFVEHDADAQWWLSFREIVAELLAEVPDGASVEAISCSGIGPCVLPVDAAGRPLRPAILYGVDTRATAQIARLEESIGRDAIHARAGNHLSSQSAGPKISWLHDNEPQVHDAASRFVTSQTYLVGRLTDEWVIDHGTAGYFHPLYDLAERRWDVTGCEEFVRVDQLPTLAWAGDIAGTVTAAAAAETGLVEGTPVLVGTSDALAEALSCGTVDVGDMMAMYGSSHFFIQVVDKPITDAGLYAAPYLTDETWVLAAGTSTAGTITRWFVDLLGIEQDTSGSMFAELAEEAADSPPGARGLLSLPHFSGERTPLNDPEARGVIVGLTVSHARADVYRSLLEGIGYGVGEVFACYAAAGAPAARVRAVGGGTKNPVWLSVVSDVTGHAQEVFAGLGASFGDAILAAVAVGILPDHRAAAAWIEREATVEPEPDRQAFYEQRAMLWRRLQDAMTPIAHELARSSTQEDQIS